MHGIMLPHAEVKRRSVCAGDGFGVVALVVHWLERKEGVNGRKQSCLVMSGETMSVP